MMMTAANAALSTPIAIQSGRLLEGKLCGSGDWGGGSSGMDIAALSGGVFDRPGIGPVAVGVTRVAMTRSA
jgi:hypothetical protein